MLKSHSLLLFCSLILSACGGSNSNSPPLITPPTPVPTYSASIVRTEGGIPHITAQDWQGLGYGVGVAYGQDNYCVLMRQILFANGQSAEFLGAEGDLNSDLIYAVINGDEEELTAQWYEPQTADMKALINGYVAGINRYFTDTGVTGLAEGDEGCRNTAWARRITRLDMLKYLRRLTLQGSTDNGTIRRLISDTTPPTATANKPTAAAVKIERVNVSGAGNASPSVSNVAMQAASKSLNNTLLFADLIDVGAHGSNAIAVGRDSSQTGIGLLLGNPHQPWQGNGRFYQMHLTIPGVYDAMGASLHGIPLVNIGFNKDIAWTHTVSFANRLTLYELRLNPNNPLQYEYDGQMRDITKTDVSLKQLNGDGTTTTVDRSLYSSHFGPILNLKSQNALLDGWPIAVSGTVFSFRDANINNFRGLNQWTRVGQSTSIAQLSDALKDVGFPWVHTIAADRNGQAFYGDISSIPHVDQAKLDLCVAGPLAPLLTAATGSLIIALDGSRSACEWGSDSDSPEGSNVFGYSSLPKLTNTDYVANSNNSYWLSNTQTPLTGFPIIMGALGGENEQQFMRTRISHQMVAQRKTASDGLSATPMFNLQTLKDLMFSNHVLGAQVALDDILAACPFAASPAANLAKVTLACEVLRQWDRRTNNDSRGAALFTEFWTALKQDFDAAAPIEIENQTLWTQDFDQDNPVVTPAGFALGDPAIALRVSAALVTAVTALQDADVVIGSEFGGIQAVTRNNAQIPIHGGLDDIGVFGVIKVKLEQGGYKNVSGGNSYIQAVTWDDSACPIADAILAHSQSTDPASPYYSDQTQRYSDKNWLRLPFCSADVQAQTLSTTTVSE